MRKRNFVIFAVFVAAFGIAIPLMAINRDGEQELPALTGELAGGDPVSERVVAFNENCGTCHSLDAAGADGTVGPDLDELLGGASAEANEGRVSGAIENGIAGRMPAKIHQGEEATEMARFVAQVAGQ